MSGEVKVGESLERTRVARRKFPGPAGAGAELRVAMHRAAFAEVVAHAKESLEAEICGVLAGEVCEDDEGAFVEVRAAVRGSAAREGSTHVTFTQETWSAVHAEMEREHPGLQIVGWYHSHPGFGVEFSEMDRFIQRNFFPAPTQIALVTDPLGGETALCRNAEEGIRYLERFWVDGREHVARVPGVGAPASAEGGDRLEAVERRLGQVLQALDEQRAAQGRFLWWALTLVATGVACFVGYGIYQQYAGRIEPPRMLDYVPVPVRVGDKNVLIGVGVTKWEVPPELNAIYLQIEEAKREAERKAAEEKAAAEKEKP